VKDIRLTELKLSFDTALTAQGLGTSMANIGVSVGALGGTYCLPLDEITSTSCQFDFVSSDFYVFGKKC
jgi:hypothetical protein